MQREVVARLRLEGHEVYDYRKPVVSGPGSDGFHWSEIDVNWKSWSKERYRDALSHPIAERGFLFDMNALRTCDACVLVLPCGRSAHLELGWAVGAGKLTIVLLHGENEPELMVKMCDRICLTLDEVVRSLNQLSTTDLGGSIAQERHVRNSNSVLSAAKSKDSLQ